MFLIIPGSEGRRPGPLVADALRFCLGLQRGIRCGLVTSDAKLTGLFVLFHVLDELFKRWSYLTNGLVTDVGRNRLPLLHAPFRICVPAPTAVVDVYFSHITTTDSQT